MEITIFEGVVIESALTELEAEGKKYDGLYVDMEDAPQRKYVKDKASLIGTLKKKVDRVRIDAAKTYKLEVERQAAAIHERLDEANAPFQVLIDDYALERKKILDAEKARKQAIIDAEQLENEHEIALLMNKTFEFDREQELKAQAELESARLVEREEYAAEQVRLADERQKQGVLESLQRTKDAENARLANKEHKAFINNECLEQLLLSTSLSTEQAKEVIIALAKNQVNHIKINY